MHSKSIQVAPYVSNSLITIFYLFYQKQTHRLPQIFHYYKYYISQLKSKDQHKNHVSRD